MPVLTVRCGRDPFAVIEVRDARHLAVAKGTGEVLVDVPPGDYVVSASAAGREDVRRVQVSHADVAVERKLGPRPSAAPMDWTSTDVYGHGAAAQHLSEQLVAHAGGCAVGVILRRPAGAGTGMLPRQSDGSLPVRLAGRRGAVDLAWTTYSSPTGEYATAGAAVSQGALLATIGDDPASSLVVPAWDGWQTLLFLPVVADGVAVSLAVMHVVPIGAPWRPTLPLADLLDQLHWALIERPVVTDGCMAALRRLAGPQMSPSPLLHLMLGALASASPGTTARQQARQSFDVLDHDRVGAVVLSDVAALRLAVDGETDPGPVTVSECPLLARSADVLFDRECRTRQTIHDPTVDAMATRLASALWFRWIPRVPPVDVRRIDSYAEPTWRQELARTATALATVESLDEVADVGEPSLPRLVAYLHDESQRRRSTPQDVLIGAHPGEIVRGSGLPALGVLRALRALHAVSLINKGPGPDRAERGPVDRHRFPARPWALMVVVAVAIAIAVWVWSVAAGDDDDDDVGPAEGTEQSLTTPPGPTTTPRTSSPSVSGPVPGQPNQPPTAQPLRFETLEGADLTATLAGTDPDGDGLTYRILDGPDAGDIQLDPNGSFEFFPKEEQERATFTYVASDGVLESLPEEVVVDVLPQASADAASAEEEDGALVVGVELTRAASVPMVVELAATDPGAVGSATLGQDFELPLTVEFAAGSAAEDVVITLIDDDQDEGDAEFFGLLLAVRFDGTAQPVPARMTIRDTEDVSSSESTDDPSEPTDPAETTFPPDDVGPLDPDGP